MKHEIITFFKENRSFDEAVRLYAKYGLRKSFKIILNRQGFSIYNENLLHEELRKLAELSDKEFKAILSKPVRKKQVEIKKQNPQNKKLSEIPHEVKKTIRLREEFPFLKNKDCPNELKILVSDMLSAYETYKTDHKKLFEETTEKELQALSKSVVENYLENKLIWKELNHYKEKGKILGQHPIFTWLKRLEKIRAMKNPELIKLREQVKNKIHRTNKLLKDQPNHPETAKRKEREKLFIKELAEADRLLGINEK